MASKNIISIANKKFKITRSKRKGKKYKATPVNSKGKSYHFAASGYKVGPGSDRGDNYCSRSAGIKSSKISGNAFARALWSCKGKKSISKKPFFGKVKL